MLLLLFGAQIQAQTLKPQTRLDDNSLTQLIAQQESAVLDLRTQDFHFEDRIVSGPGLANEIVRLSELVQRIEPEKRPYLVLSNCSVEGNVELAQRRISIPLQFNQVTFKGVFNLKGALFERSLNFTNFCTFEQAVVLSEATIFNIDMGVDPTETTFHGEVDAAKSIFTGIPAFAKAIFRQRVSFKGAQFRGGVLFNQASFADESDFSSTSFSDSAIFSKAVFGGKTTFTGADFNQTADFSEASFNHKASFGQVKFKGRADFGGTKLTAVFFDRSFFSDSALFNSATISRFVSFVSVRFTGEVDFEGCTFPSISHPSPEVPGLGDVQHGVELSDTRFEKRVHLSFEQLFDGPAWRPFRNPRTRIFGDGTYRSVRVWENLGNVFKNGNDLYSQNEAEYQKNFVMAYRNENGFIQSAGNRVNRVFWGYGVRPWRVGFWIFLSYLVFAGLYWSQAWQLSRTGGWEAQWDRIKFAARFSWRTAYKLFYGYENSRTTLFKVLTLVQSLGTKALLFFFFKSLANISPLFSELVNKVLP